MSHESANARLKCPYNETMGLCDGVLLGALTVVILAGNARDQGSIPPFKALNFQPTVTLLNSELEVCSKSTRTCFPFILGAGEGM